MDPLLSVRRLRTHFDLRRGIARAVDDVSFDVARREVVGIVGESGSGKSVTALSVFRVVGPPGRIVGGEVRLDGVDLLGLPEAELRRIRGRRMAMVFQNPRGCLNPVMSVGVQIASLHRLHRRSTRRDAEAAAREMLRRVQIADPRRVFDAYPHQLSGGMCQRVMIGMALACEPELIIADEPTTGLDVTVQRQVLSLLVELAERTGVAQIIISHDLGVIANACQRVVVMYAGKVAEISPVRDLYREPLHPYARGLVASTRGAGSAEALRAMAGEVPDPVAPPSGCRFHPRCVHVMAECRTQEPTLRATGGGRLVACHLYGAEAA